MKPNADRQVPRPRMGEMSDSVSRCNFFPNTGSVGGVFDDPRNEIKRHEIR